MEQEGASLKSDRKNRAERAREQTARFAHPISSGYGLNGDMHLFAPRTHPGIHHRRWGIRGAASHRRRGRRNHHIHRRLQSCCRPAL